MRKVSKYKGLSLIDICMQEYGGVEGIMSLAKDNGLAIDSELAITSLVKIDEEVESVVRKTLPVLPVLLTPPQVNTVVSSGQSVIDLVLQEYGNIEGIVNFLKLNNLGPTSSPITGTKIRIEASEIVDAKVRELFKSAGIIVNTGYPGGASPVVANGIGLMVIENNFIVG